MVLSSRGAPGVSNNWCSGSRLQYRASRWDGASWASAAWARSAPAQRRATIFFHSLRGHLHSNQPPIIENRVFTNGSSRDSGASSITINASLRCNDSVEEDVLCEANIGYIVLPFLSITRRVRCPGYAIHHMVLPYARHLGRAAALAGMEETGNRRQYDA